MDCVFKTRRDVEMKVSNPHELVGKEVFDAQGNVIGVIDKAWNSWNKEHPGYFFGIRPNENARDTWFRGTYKLIPIYCDYIREVTDRVVLNKTMDELYRFWNKTIPCGPTTYPTDELVDMPVYDKNHSRIGTFCAWVETDGTFKNYGCFVDPYICDTWNVPHNILMPIHPNYICDVKDTITLDKTLEELKQYWKQYYNF
jgi:sporulation protein YlmC with PRC-barrel domain